MVLVTGATGKIGSVVVRLLAEASVPVRAFVRDPAKVQSWSGVDIVEGNLDDAASVSAALAGVEKVVLVTAANAAQELAFVPLAKTAGVRKIVKISAMGADAQSKLTFARGHAEVETALKSSGTAWTILRPGMFAQNFLQSAETVKQQGKLFASAKQGRAAMIDTRDVAEVAVKVLAPEHDGKTYILTGDDAISHDDAARIIGAAIGRPVTYVDMPPEKTKKALVERGVPAWLADELVLLQETLARTMEPVVTRDVQKLLGRPPRKFADFAHDYADAFR